MTPEQRKLFDELAADRIDSHRVFQKKSLGGIWKGIVEKYSDKAHFIYELLQNADDAKATEVQFEIRAHELLFAHNGTRHFTISSVESENGDVNAITAVANSNKQTASIGKFGVGFKSVFQYTDAPWIYDRDFCFRIDNFIVPVLLEEVPADIETMRAEGWTVFVFPFKDGQHEKSVSDIFRKLESLDRPLLFLNSLRKIGYKNASAIGSYEIESSAIPNRDTSIRVETVSSRHTPEPGKTPTSERFVKFSRSGCNGHSYSVVFGTDATFSKLHELQGPVYCFFPTQRNPGLKFLVHAPFLLTDSREGIQETEYNAGLIDDLGLLASDSLVFLRNWGIDRGIPIIDDTVFNVVPTYRQSFLDSSRPISFAPIFTRIQSCLKERGVLSSIESEPLAERYVTGTNAYWAESADIPKLFDNMLLAELIGTPGAKWVFTTSGRPVANWFPGKDSLRDYKDGLIAGHFSFSDLLDKITPGFLSARPREWLERLYLFIQRHHSSASQLENVKSKAIFLGKDGLFHPALVPDAAGKAQPSLFLPSKEAAFSHATILEPSLLEKLELAEFFQETLRLQEPSIRDEVFNTILPKYRPGKAVDRFMEDMRLIFRAWQDGTERDRKEIENAVKNTPCLLADNGKCLRTPSSLYLPSDDLHLWFEGCDVHFLAKDKYQEAMAESDFPGLIHFFENIGVRSSPKILERRETKQERDILEKDCERFPLSSDSSGFGRRWIIKTIDGLEEVLHRTHQKKDPRLSVLLWNTLKGVFEARLETSLSSLFEAHYEWYYYRNRRISFQSQILERLGKMEWLLSREGQWMAPCHVHIRDLQGQYDISSPAAKVLIEGLGISDAAPGMTTEQETKLRKFDKLSRLMAEAGLSNEQLEAELEERAREREAEGYENPNVHQEMPATPTNSLFPRHSGDIDSESRSGENTSVMPQPPPRTPQFLKGALETVDSAAVSRPEPTKSPIAEKTIDEKLGELERKTEEAKQAIVVEQELQTSLHNLPPTSFGWFVNALAYGNLGIQKRGSSKAAFAITFGRVERDESADRTIVLSLPNRDIPAQLAETDDIRIEMQQSDSLRTFRAVGASIDSDRLVVLLSREEKIEGYDFSRVGRATISVSDPDFLSQRLEERFRALQKPDGASFLPADDLTRFLPPNDRVTFVFGPPGTGKTEQLAKILLSRMIDGGSGKILVLAPTNKAADVLTLRILELARKHPTTPPTDWLVRFGGTMDETLQRDGKTYREKNVDVSAFDKLVLVTTVARYPYDTTRPNHGTGSPLRAEKWTDVFLDEASMIELPYALYLLLQQPQASFVIAGAPKQLPPVTQNPYLEDKNVYTFLGIDSFELERTPMGDYAIRRLERQYRSVPAIGDVFSRFAYSGHLQHARTPDSIRPLGLESRMAPGPVNIIRFPFDAEHENIYRPRAVGGSAFHVYSALFSAEFALFLDKIVSVKKGEEAPSIGIVSPYKVQAALISRIIEHRLAERPGRCKILVGTAHKFQGDQCTIMIVCLNPPGHASAKSFVNRESLLNVAVSRASDCLFLLVPDKDTPGLEQLKWMKWLEAACAVSGSGAISFKSNEMECEMFGTDNPQWLADNTFITGHMDVNVYDHPVKRYEVRFDEHAVDVQMTKET